MSLDFNYGKTEAYKEKGKDFFRFERQQIWPIHCLVYDIAAAGYSSVTAKNYKAMAERFAILGTDNELILYRERDANNLPDYTKWDTTYQKHLHETFEYFEPYIAFTENNNWNVRYKVHYTEAWLQKLIGFTTNWGVRESDAEFNKKVLKRQAEGKLKVSNSVSYVGLYVPDAVLEESVQESVQ